MKYRISNKYNYTVISNTCIRDKNLSLKAKGLHTLMMSLPDNWEYSIRGLTAICKESKTAVMSALRELIDAGYVKRVKIQSAGNGFHKWIYSIYEAPQSGSPGAENPCSENPNAENPNAENPCAENRTQINKDIINKDKLNKDVQSIDDVLAKIQNKKLEEALREFLKMRRERKKPIGAAALKMLVKKLCEMADDPDTRARIVEQSVRNGWLDIYALKKDYGGEKNETLMFPTADTASIEERFMERIAV
ncbi:MAG: helix-turn-helix domain-containing protein [Candidatus Ornithomonoglobus sp.]